MKLVNLTPHWLVVFHDDAEVLRQAPSGAVARLTEVRQPGPDFMVDGVPVATTALRYDRTIVGLPEPQPGVCYVVSRVTAAEVADRADVLFPLDEVRNSEGQIVGCNGLGRFVHED